MTKTIRDISELTDYDYVKIVSTYKAQTNEMFNCKICLENKNSEVLRKRNGCTKEVDYRVYKYPERESNLSYTMCPGNFFDQAVISIMFMHRKFKEGVMPYTGALSEQPNKVIEFFYLMDSMIKEDQLKDGKPNRNRTPGRPKAGSRGGQRA